MDGVVGVEQPTRTADNYIEAATGNLAEKLVFEPAGIPNAAFGMVN